MILWLLTSLSLAGPACVDLVDCDQKCRAKDAIACAALGDHWKQTPPERFVQAQAVLAWARACELGNKSGCLQVAVAQSEGRGLAVDERAAAQKVEQLCADRFVPACVHQLSQTGQGFTAEERNELADRSAGMAQSSCSMGGVEDCFYAPAIYQAVLADMRRGKEAANVLRQTYQKSCESGEFSECWSLGHIHARGKWKNPDSGAFRDASRDTVLLGPMDGAQTQRWYERGDELALFACRAAESAVCMQLYDELSQRSRRCHADTKTQCLDGISTGMKNLCEEGVSRACR